MVQSSTVLSMIVRRSLLSSVGEGDGAAHVRRLGELCMVFVGKVFVVKKRCRSRPLNLFSPAIQVLLLLRTSTFLRLILFHIIRFCVS